MKSNRDSGFEISIFICSLVVSVLGFKLIEVTGVSMKVAFTAITSCLIWLLFFGLALYGRYKMDMYFIIYLYPVFAAALWIIFTPFLDHWAVWSHHSTLFEPRLMFYGTAWFQVMVSFLILIGGYGVIFYQSRGR